MEEKNKTLFERFSCKCGECRNTCCVGWNVTISLQEYFRFMNFKCNKKFKEKIDNGIFILTNPNNDRYAMIKKNYYGDCVFHGEDGLCEIQKNFGEKAIASVCREYPRSELLNRGKSISNSCERVLEILFEDNDFVKYNTLENDDNPVYPKVIEILQKRKLSFEERFILIGKMENKEINVGKYLRDVNLMLKIFLDYTSYYLKKNAFIDEVYEKVANIDSNSYLNKENILYKDFPNFDIILEKMIVNHVHFKSYPENVISKLYNDSYLSLIGVYVVLKIICSCLYNENSYNNKEGLIDALSHTFRIIEHSGFDLAFGLYLKNEVSLDDVFKMI